MSNSTTIVGSSTHSGSGVNPEFAGINLYWVESLKAIGIALLASCLATCISTYNIYTHLRYYTNPELQRYIIRILIVVPLYAICSWLSLAWPHAGPIFE